MKPAALLLGLLLLSPAAPNPPPPPPGEQETKTIRKASAAEVVGSVAAAASAAAAAAASPVSRIVQNITNVIRVPAPNLMQMVEEAVNRALAPGAAQARQDLERTWADRMGIGWDVYYGVVSFDNLRRPHEQGMRVAAVLGLLMVALAVALHYAARAAGSPSDPRAVLAEIAGGMILAVLSLYVVDLAGRVVRMMLQAIAPEGPFRMTWNLLSGTTVNAAVLSGGTLGLFTVPIFLFSFAATALAAAGIVTLLSLWPAVLYAMAGIGPVAAVLWIPRPTRGIFYLWLRLLILFSLSVPAVVLMTQVYQDIATRTGLLGGDFNPVRAMTSAISGMLLLGATASVTGLATRLSVGGLMSAGRAAVAVLRGDLGGGLARGGAGGGRPSAGLIGAGVGAAVGTLLLPGVGTAAGTAVGGLVGAGTGAAAGTAAGAAAGTAAGTATGAAAGTAAGSAAGGIGAGLLRAAGGLYAEALGPSLRALGFRVGGAAAAPPLDLARPVPLSGVAARVRDLSREVFSQQLSALMENYELPPALRQQVMETAASRFEAGFRRAWERMGLEGQTAVLSQRAFHGMSEQTMRMVGSGRLQDRMVIAVRRLSRLPEVPEAERERVLEEQLRRIGDSAERIGWIAAMHGLGALRPGESAPDRAGGA